MADSIPALIAEARKAQVAVYIAAPEPVAEDLHRIIKGLADALESLSASPSGDEREALREAIFDYGGEHPENVSAGGIADAILAAGFRRLSPLTQEALVEALKQVPGHAWDPWDEIGDLSPVAEELLPILSRFSLPEPAENPVLSAIESAKAEIAAGRRASVVMEVPEPAKVEWRVEYPVSRSDPGGERESRSFTDAGERSQFERYINGRTQNVTVFERHIYRSEWLPVEEGTK